MTTPPLGPGTIYFYPHPYLRDRQIDTVRRWTGQIVVNPEIANRKGAQVSKGDATAAKPRVPWQRRIPIPNIKRRPEGAPPTSIVYAWGALMATGPFIVDLDSPLAMTGYNTHAFTIYAPLLRHLLLSSRCLAIRCLSRACQRSLELMLGWKVAQKSQVHYPVLTERPSEPAHSPCRFLFVGTQFDLKGGPSLLRAFKRVSADHPGCTLDLITHLDSERAAEARSIPGIRLHPAEYSREQVFENFMSHSDVLVLPTFAESFGMVALEALSCGLAVISTDIYALSEIVENNMNGILLKPPVSMWEGHLPSPYFSDPIALADAVARADKRAFEDQLTRALAAFATSPNKLSACRMASRELFRHRFAG